MHAPATELEPSNSRRLQDCQELLSWLRAGGARGLEHIRAGMAEGEGAGIGVFAAQDLAAGDLVISIPRALCLTAAAGHAGTAPDGLAPDANLAATLLQERRLGPASFFARYIAALPQEHEFRHHPFFWRREDMELFQASPRARRQLRLASMRTCARVRAMMAKGVAETQDEARWALAVVRSRSFPLEGAPGNGMSPYRLALCPLVDLLNHHAPEPGAAETPAARYRCSPDGSPGLVAERAVAAGEELRHLYAICPSAELLAAYGFVPEGGTSGFEVCNLEVPCGELLAGGLAASAARHALLHSRGLWRGGRLGRPLLLPLGGSPSQGGRLLPVARLAALGSAGLVEALGPQLLEGAELPPAAELRARALARRWLAAQRDRAGGGAAAAQAASEAALAGRAARRLLLAEQALLERWLAAWH